MAIRLRKIENTYVALCAVESDKKNGDIYLDDNMHHALATKFAIDFNSEGNYGIAFDEVVAELMESQKVRDAQEEAEKWSAERHHNKRLQQSRTRVVFRLCCPLKEKQEFITTKFWKSSVDLLRKIYAETGEPMTRIFDRLVKQEWQRIQEGKKND